MLNLTARSQTTSSYLVMIGCSIFCVGFGCQHQQPEQNSRILELKEELKGLRDSQSEAAKRLAAFDRWTHRTSSDIPAESTSNRFTTRIAEVENELISFKSLLIKRQDDASQLELQQIETLLESTPNGVFRFIEGIDHVPVLLTVDDKQHDLFFQTVLSSDPIPSTLDDVLEKIATVVPGLTRSSFLVGEGSQIPVDLLPVSEDRGFRFVVIWNRNSDTEILLGTPAGARTGFLEVMSWDAQKRAFNYYERLQPEDPIWFWKGDSSHSLVDQSRGQACFRCHINGSPIMRELSRPWNNWHSEAAGISTTVPDEIRRVQPRRDLFRQMNPAQILENRVRTGIKRWDTERMTRSLDGDAIRDVNQWLRQLTTTTTVNLISSQTKSDAQSAIDPSKVDLPLSFFLNGDALSAVLSKPLPIFDGQITRSHYDTVLARHDFQLFNNLLDTFFAFLVPVPSAEDASAVRMLIDNGIVTRKLVASILMVDFPNAIYSAKRQQLFDLTRRITDGSFSATVESDVTDQIVAAIGSTNRFAHPSTTALIDVQNMPAADQFRFYYDLPAVQWEDIILAHISEYFGFIRKQLDSVDGVDEYLMLADSRRAQFATIAPGVHMIQESDILFPHTSFESRVEMGVNGRPRLP